MFIFRGGFMSVTQVLISSGLLEKLVMKYLTSPPSPSSGIISPLSPPISSPSTPSSDSSDAYDTEVQKLFSLCLDLGDDEVGMFYYLKIFFKINIIFIILILTIIFFSDSHNNKEIEIYQRFRETTPHHNPTLFLSFSLSIYLCIQKISLFSTPLSLSKNNSIREKNSFYFISSTTCTITTCKGINNPIYSSSTIKTFITILQRKSTILSF